jgi:hypothetical protein
MSQSKMNVNSTKRAKPVTEADRRTLSYANMLAGNIFGVGYKAPVLVYPSYFDSDHYLATLVVVFLALGPFEMPISWTT